MWGRGGVYVKLGEGDFVKVAPATIGDKGEVLVASQTDREKAEGTKRSINHTRIGTIPADDFARVDRGEG